MDIIKRIKYFILYYLFMCVAFGLFSLIGLAILINTNSYFSSLSFEADGLAENISIYNAYVFTIPIIVLSVIVLYSTIKKSDNRMIKLITFIIIFLSVSRIDRIIKSWIYTLDTNNRVICVYILLFVCLLLTILIIKNNKRICEAVGDYYKD